MKEEDLGAIRLGAELQNMKPIIGAELSMMQKAIINSVLSAVNSGQLTPEMALSKWMEYIAYQKIIQRIDQRIEVGKSVGGVNSQKLDFSADPRYTANSK